MNVAAFILLAAMLGAYVMLDGWDLGVGVIHLIFARTDDERESSFAAIGPFWSGNEVVLIAAGATLFAIFPKVYAASFSGFYLPFIIVLWLLMVRGMSIELRSHFQSELWCGFWDVAFSVSSILLAFIFGLAIGNIVRGVPLDANGYFTGTFGFLLNGYAVAVGLLALFALSMHGAAYAALRTAGTLEQRARYAANVSWYAVVVLYLLVTAITLRLHPLNGSVALLIAPLVALASLIAARIARQPAHVFTATCVFLVALIASAAESLFPYLLPAFPIGTGGLDIYNGASGEISVTTGFTVACIGCGAALIYGTIAARKLLEIRRSS